MHSYMRISCLYFQHVVVDSLLRWQLSPNVILSSRVHLFVHFGYMQPKEYQIYFVSCVLSLSYASFDAVDVLHIKFVLFVFTFIQQKQNENQKFTWNTLCRIHSTCSLILLSVEYSFFLLEVYAYMCVSTYRIICDNNRTGLYSFWI